MTKAELKQYLEEARDKYRDMSNHSENDNQLLLYIGFAGAYQDVLNHITEE